MVTFLMSIFCVAFSYAQKTQNPQQTPAERAAKRVEMLKKSLNLTDDQAVKLQEAQTQLFNDMKQIRGTHGNGDVNREDMKAKREDMKAKGEDMKAKGEDIKAKGERMQTDNPEMKAKREAMRTEMKAKRDAYDATLKTILTPDQYQKYQDLQKDRQKNWDKKMQKGKKFQGDHQKNDPAKTPNNQ